MTFRPSDPETTRRFRLRFGPEARLSSQPRGRSYRLPLSSIFTATLTLLFAGLIATQPGFAEDEEEETTSGVPFFVSVRPLIQTLGNETEINGDTLDGETGWAVAGSAGLRLNDYVIYELLSVEYAKSRYDNEKFANLILVTDFRFGVFDDSLPVNPYLLVGLGAARVDLELAPQGFGNVTDWSLAWQLGAGLTYPAPHGVSIGIFYRYTHSASNNAGHRMPPFDWAIDFHSLGVEINFEKTFFE
ncbi:MAG: outer membrane beta-barrel protein [Myxococcota bacterium]